MYTALPGHQPPPPAYNINSGDADCTHNQQHNIYDEDKLHVYLLLIDKCKSRVPDIQNNNKTKTLLPPMDGHGGAHRIVGQ